MTETYFSILMTFKGELYRNSHETEAFFSFLVTFLGELYRNSPVTETYKPLKVIK